MQIDNRIKLLMIFMILILLGIIAIPRIPLTVMPRMSYPGLTIQTEYPGVSPDKIEEIITIPIEDIISTIGGIQKTYSTSEEGKSRINVEFSRNSDIDLKSAEIRARIDLITDMFPREVREPVILRYDQQNRPVMIVSLISNEMTLNEIRDIADREVKKQIEGIDGVSEVYVSGGMIKEVMVHIDMMRLQSYKIPINSILNMLQAHNVNASSGKIERSGEKSSIHIKGRYKNLSQIRNTVLSHDGSGAVFLSDIADVSFVYRDQESSSRINGEERVNLYIHKSGEANLVKISNLIRNRLLDLQRNNLHFEIFENQAELLYVSLRNISICFLTGIFLVFMYIRRKTGGLFSLIFCSIIPLGFIISSLFFYLLNVDYNFIVISGTVISVSGGLTFIGSSIYSNNSLLLCNNFNKNTKIHFVSIVLILSVFFPILFFNKGMKLFYGNIAFSIIILMIFFLFLSSFFLPLIIHKDYSLHTCRGKLQDSITLVTEKIYFYLRKFKYVTNKNAGACFACYFLLLITIYGIYNLCNKEMMNPLEDNIIYANIEFSSGTSFERTSAITKKIEQKISAVSSVSSINSRIDPAHSTLTIKIDSNNFLNRDIIPELEKLTTDTNEAFVYFSRGSDQEMLREITVDVLGQKLETIDEIVRELAEKTSKFKGVSNVILRYKKPRPEMRIAIDKIKAQKSGLAPSHIGETLRLAIQGGVATKMIYNNREIDIRVRYKQNFRNNLQDVENYNILNNTGKLVPLNEIADIQYDTIPVKIYRKNKKRTLSYSARISGDIFSVVAQLNDLLYVNLPDDYRIEFGDDLKESVRNQRYFKIGMFGGFLLIFMVLSAYFESYRKTFVVFFTLPIPFFFIFLFFAIIRLSVSIPVYLGVIMVSGLTAHNALKLIDSQKNNKEISREYIEQQFNIMILIVLFYFPFLFNFGSGGALLRGISLALIPGTIASALLTPLAISFFYSIFYENVLQNDMHIRKFYKILIKLKTIFFNTHFSFFNTAINSIKNLFTR